MRFNVGQLSISSTTTTATPPAQPTTSSSAAAATATAAAAAAETGGIQYSIHKSGCQKSTLGTSGPP